MKIYILLLTIGSCFFSQFCQGQECQSVQRIDTKEGVAYMGIAGITKVTTVTGSQLIPGLVS
ncbi:hypothetical protein [Spirosoma pollinicola]|uniref:Uncharacterized protein n=1 Tax=Spirosoma pollinicola TaxID=2057025 RepID=A0A2K8Z3A5_9BACT|nr:hypothetical protein [Spirosoma pollinicola]AUD04367.1 hypothetical protein CWM47_22495 [Spirosoma pollinicola]